MDQLVAGVADRSLREPRRAVQVVLADEILAPGCVGVFKHGAERATVPLNIGRGAGGVEDRRQDVDRRDHGAAAHRFRDARPADEEGDS